MAIQNKRQAIFFIPLRSVGELLAIFVLMIRGSGCSDGKVVIPLCRRIPSGKFLRGRQARSDDRAPA